LTDGQIVMHGQTAQGIDTLTYADTSTHQRATRAVTLAKSLPEKKGSDISTVSCSIIGRRMTTSSASSLVLPVPSCHCSVARQVFRKRVLLKRVLDMRGMR